MNNDDFGGAKQEYMKLPTETDYKKGGKLVNLEQARGGSHKVMDQVDQEIEDYSKLVQNQ